ncbi:cytoplasmic tRNA 2-thiolation protein 1 [Amazona ochrocephala]
MPPPRCHLCPLPASLLRPRCGTPLCRRCFMQRFEAELLSSITPVPGSRIPIPAPGSTVAVAASGGKDSTVLSHLLQRFAPRLGLRLALVSVDEGIAGYREAALDAVRKGRGGAPLLVLSHRDLFGWSVDEVGEALGPGSRCTFCGVLRRQALERAARLLGADCIATGHNADDIAETLLMNFLRGDVARLQRTAAEGGGGSPMESPTETMESSTETMNTMERPTETMEKPIETVGTPIETSRSSIGVPTGPPSTLIPVESTKDPIESTKDPIESTKDAIESTEDAIESTEDAIESTEDAIESTKDPIESTEDAIETLLSFMGLAGPIGPSRKDPRSLPVVPSAVSEYCHIEASIGRSSKDPRSLPVVPSAVPECCPIDTPIGRSSKDPRRLPVVPSAVPECCPIETPIHPTGRSRKDPAKAPRLPPEVPAALPECHPIETPIDSSSKAPSRKSPEVPAALPVHRPIDPTAGPRKVPTRRAPGLPPSPPARPSPWPPVPRCKPLRHALEKEIVLYAHFRRLNYVSTECVHAARAFRGHARALLKGLEASRAVAAPALGHSSRRLRAAADGPGGDPWRRRTGRRPLGACARCGFAASQGLCKACVLQGALRSGRPRVALGKRAVEAVGGEVGAGGHGPGAREAVDPRGVVEVEVVGAGGRSQRRRVLGLGRARGALNIWDF